MSSAPAYPNLVPSEVCPELAKSEWSDLHSALVRLLGYAHFEHERYGMVENGLVKTFVQSPNHIDVDIVQTFGRGVLMPQGNLLCEEVNVFAKRKFILATYAEVYSDNKHERVERYNLHLYNMNPPAHFGVTRFDRVTTRMSPEGRLTHEHHGEENIITPEQYGDALAKVALFMERAEIL